MREVQILRSLPFFATLSEQVENTFLGWHFPGVSPCFTQENGKSKHQQTIPGPPLVINMAIENPKWCFNGNRIYKLSIFRQNMFGYQNFQIHDQRRLCASCKLAVPGGLKPPMSGLPDLMWCRRLKICSSFSCGSSLSLVIPNDSHIYSRIS